MTAASVQTALRAEANPAKAAFYPRFFKSGPGQYGEGDQFIGVTVPQQRKIARAHRGLHLPEIARLLASPTHEVRLTGLLILVLQYQRAKDPVVRADIARFYLDYKSRVNNWDLVDSSAEFILGPHYFGQDQAPLFHLAASPSLWDRRIALLTTAYYIKNHHYNTTLQLVQRLLTDPHDLIHKAAGWMLREIGKRDRPTLIAFLDQYAHRMPRTMLRYAIEHLSPDQRRHYLAK